MDRWMELTMGTLNKNGEKMEKIYSPRKQNEAQHQESEEKKQKRKQRQREWQQQPKAAWHS